jgi:4-hydroxybenzoate polyprenyltransferase
VSLYVIALVAAAACVFAYPLARKRRPLLADVLLLVEAWAWLVVGGIDLSQHNLVLAGLAFTLALVALVWFWRRVTRSERRPT